MDIEKKKLLFIIGTRPEAIKQIPILKRFAKDVSRFECIPLITAQHREMLDQVLRIFNVKPKYDLDLMKADQTLSHITVEALSGIEKIIKKELPDMIFVQGDTTSTFVGALAGFYHKVPVAHVEAGLRTHDKTQPYPEEMNRVLTSHLVDLHFAPTEEAMNNLLNEAVPSNRIWVTGNSVIDALLSIANRPFHFKNELLSSMADTNKRFILVTAHRRENHGEPMKRICYSLIDIVESFPDVEVIYPVHLSPQVQKVVNEIMHHERIHLIPPLDYEAFIQVMKMSYMILSDSGGVQEEAPSLGKPVLVLRETTERPEAVTAGTVELVGTSMEKIISRTSELLKNKASYDKMSKAINPYGDGETSNRIYNLVCEYFENGL
ncbi:MAG: UDP-N-acetylglucosamine 2-epimerase (non-hydrolyzing) [Desulfatiglans sp.]|jgi:UDP-N-acetylglucosamine 2-epimerase (non-hydrolysing)|nr:UDP-N-acetylglucosamine 2-epimerase (non-hydrolyzing) [Desulfatiglans sp.]